jgi:uncharacterized protein (DUF305 family)
MKSQKLSVLAFLLSVATAYAAPASQATPPSTALTSGTSHNESGMPPMKGSDMESMHMTSSPNAAKAPTDLQFIDTMSMHHRMAIDMAELARSRAEHAELKAMATKMVGDQQKDTAQLKDWREQWYAGKPVALNMKMPGMPESMKGMSMQKLAAANGAEFDRMFVEMMSRHHAGAIKMSEAAAPMLQHAEVKAFAKKVLISQKEELAQMKDWKKNWSEAKR